MNTGQTSTPAVNSSQVPPQQTGGEAIINYAAERLQLVAWFIAIASLLGIAALITRAGDLPPLYEVTRWLAGGSAACLVIMLAYLINVWGERSFMWPRWTWRFADLGVAGLAALVAAQWSYLAADPTIAQYLAGLLWIVAVAGALLAVWPRPEAHSEHEIVPAWEVFALSGLLLLALALRSINLHGLPDVLTADETRLALTARAYQQGQLFRPFSTELDGQWGLWFMALDMMARLLGETVKAVRLPALILGTLSVLASYALTRLLWGRRPALIAAALLAAYHFHIHFSRSALNNIYDTFFFMTTFGFIWLGWRRQSRWPWLLGALALGLAQYVAPAGRLLIIECAVLGLFWLITDRPRLRAQLFNIALAVGVFAVLVIPIVYFARLQPDDYLTHFNQTNILRNGWLNAVMQTERTGAVQILWRQLTDTIKLIAAGPDMAFYPGQALLTPAMAVLGLLGLLYLLFRIKEGRAFFLVSSLLIAVVLGGVLAISPLAGAHRLVGALPLVYIMIAVVIDRGWAWLEQRWPAQRKWLAVLGSLAIAALMIGDAYYYFGSFSSRFAANNPGLEWGTRVGEYLHQFEAHADDWQVYCIEQDSAVCQHPAIQYLAPQLAARMRVVDYTMPPDGLVFPPGTNAILMAAPQYAGTAQLHQQLSHALPHEQINPSGVLVFTAFQISGEQP